MSKQDISWSKFLSGTFFISLMFLTCAGGILAVKRGGIQVVWNDIQEERRRVQFRQDWTPPASGVGGDVLFPRTVEKCSRVAEPDLANNRGLGIEDDVNHATYAGPQGTIDVYVTEADREKAASCFKALEKGLSKLHLTDTPHHVDDYWGDAYCYFSAIEPERTGWMWTSDGWLVLVIAKSNHDPWPFMEVYLTEIAGASNAANDTADQGLQ